MLNLEAGLCEFSDWNPNKFLKWLQPLWRHRQISKSTLRQPGAHHIGLAAANPFQFKAMLWECVNRNNHGGTVSAPGEIMIVSRTSACCQKAWKMLLPFHSVLTTHLSPKVYRSNFTNIPPRKLKIIIGKWLQKKNQEHRDLNGAIYTSYVCLVQSSSWNHQKWKYRGFTDSPVGWDSASIEDPGLIPNEGT